MRGFVFALERLEGRRLLAFASAVNFQPAGVSVPAGYAADSGSAFGNRAGGYQFGWDQSITTATRDRNASNAADQRYDTFIHTQLNGSRKWEMAVPNGSYSVRLVAGDASHFDSVYKLNLEGVLALSGTPTSSARWVDKTVTVNVSDGRLTLTNASGSVNNKLAFITITPTGSTTTQTPYSGTPISIASTIQAENFDNGGANVAYSDTTSGNSGNLFRSGNVDIVASTDSGGGYAIGYTRAGEWLEYTVNVPKTGTYSLDLRVASPVAGGKLHLAVDGVDKTGAITIPKTGGWQSWTTLTKTGVSLSAGTRVLRLQFDSGASTGDIANVNWIRFNETPAPVSTKPGTHNTGPTDRSKLKRITGVLEIREPGVYTDFDVTGGVSIYASNVTLRNFVSRENIKVYSGTNILMEDGEVYSTSNSDGISAQNFTARRLHVHDVHDAFRIGANSIIENCYMHDMGSENGHTDAIQAIKPVTGVVIRGNYIDAGHITSAINGVSTGWTVDRNWISADLYAIYFDSAGASPKVTNNRFSGAGLPARFRPASTVWTGNVWDATGVAIP